VQTEEGTAAAADWRSAQNGGKKSGGLSELEKTDEWKKVSRNLYRCSKKRENNQ
jgi:hypothetical protein